MHLVEEVGEVSRTLLYKETERVNFKNNTDPGKLEDEIADIFWQTLKLA
ncbi:MAG: MazG-like family protein [DPANN group archaeon]|nr:MazG-like family protein [DPANN group archaeon]